MRSRTSAFLRHRGRARSLVRVLSTRARAARSADRGEDGFILLESMVALSLITVLMAALASFTLNVVTGTNELRARQGATQLSTSTMASIGAIPASDLVTGRDTDSVNYQFDHAPDAVSPWLTTMTRRFDSSTGLAAGSGATATVPTSPTTQVLNGVTYAVSTYVGSCVLPKPTSTGASTDCVKLASGATTTGTTELRVVVAVIWSGIGCRPASCSYVTATLVNAGDDPVFNTNRAVPPPRPVVVAPGDQVSTLGGTDSLQLTVASGTGLGPFTWQVTTGVLPAGLTLSADGLVSGSPTTLVTRTPLTVTVTDAFGRTATTSFAWSVLAPPTITTPPAQTSAQGQSVSLTPTSTCPNTPCTFTLAGAPAGLSINATTGAITGTPTTAGSSPGVTVTITDADKVAVTTAPFTWTVLTPASIGTPGPLRATVGTPAGVAVAYTCSAGPCTIGLTGTAPGIGLGAAAVTTNNTTLSLQVPTGSGTVYLSGTPQTTAVPSGTSKDFAPVLKITPASGAAATATGAWTVFARPTIGAVGTRTVTVSATVDVALAYTCPNVPCTVNLTGTVPGLGVSTGPGRTTSNPTTTVTLGAATGSVWINGLVASGASPAGSTKPYAVSVSITDAATATESSSGTWTATTAPKLTNPGSQAVEPYEDISLPVTVACPNGGCTWTATVSTFGGLFTSAIPISPTGVLSYQNAPPGSYTVKVSVRDSLGLTDTTTFALTVQTFTLSIANQSTTRPASGTTTSTLDVSTLVRPLADGYTYQLTNSPSWLSLSPDGVLTATLNNATPLGRANNIAVTVTSVADASSTVTSSFSWTVQ